jgi:hypothetical protein
VSFDRDSVTYASASVIVTTHRDGNGSEAFPFETDEALCVRAMSAYRTALHEAYRNAAAIRDMREPTADIQPKVGPPV